MSFADVGLYSASSESVRTTCTGQTQPSERPFILFAVLLTTAVIVLACPAPGNRVADLRRLFLGPISLSLPANSDLASCYA